MKPFNIPWRELKERNAYLVHVHPDLIHCLNRMDLYTGFQVVCHCLYDEDRDLTNYHRQGLAADLHIEKMHPLEQLLFAEKLNLFGGIGVYGPDVWRHPGLHVDIRDREVGARWAFKARDLSGLDPANSPKTLRVQVSLDRDYIKYLLEIMP